MKITALRNVRIFHEGQYFTIKKDDSLSCGDINLSEKELKLLSESPNFKKVLKSKKSIEK
jgi:hypothetical protein